MLIFIVYYVSCYEYMNNVLAISPEINGETINEDPILGLSAFHVGINIAEVSQP